MNSTSVHRINELTPIFYWILSRKERNINSCSSNRNCLVRNGVHPPIPCHLSYGHHYLHVSTTHNRKPGRRFPWSFESSLQWFIQCQLGAGSGSDSSPQPGELVQRFDWPTHCNESFGNCHRLICIEVCTRRGDSDFGV